MSKRSSVMSVFLILSLSLATFAQLDPNSPWPMFRHDARHTGQSEFAGPPAPLLFWSFRVGVPVNPDEPYVELSPAIGSDGRVYIGSSDNRFYAFTSAGTILWSYLTGDWIEESSPAIGSDGRVFIGSDDNRMYAFTSAGALSWSYLTGKWVLASPAIGTDGKIYVGSYDNRVYAFTSGGTTVWSYIILGPPESSPALGSSDGRVYVGSWDWHMYAFTAAGGLSWSYVAGESIASSPALGTDGSAYVGCYDNFMYAFAPGGNLSWSYLTGNDIKTSSPAIESNGMIYFGSMDNRLYAIASGGALSWSYTTGDIVHSSPALGSDGSVYVGSYDDRLYAFTSSGTLSWTYAASGNIFSSPALGSDGTLSFHTYNRLLYCIGKEPAPVPTATPTVAPVPTETPTPNYVELRVEGGGDFNPGDIVTLHWETFEERYGFTGVPCMVYLGAAMDPPVEDTVVTVEDIVTRSRALYLFDSRQRASKYDPRSVKPAYRNVRFPVPNIGSSGNLNFKVPRGAAGRWVFAAAFVRSDNGQFPANPPVELSNGFTLYP